MQEEEQGTPIWLRRPAWMYLPHQFDGGQSDGGESKRRKLQPLENDHAAKEDERIRIIEAGKRAGRTETEKSEAKRAGDEGQSSAAGGPREEEGKNTEVRARTIRGRETSPGATAGHLGLRDGQHREGADHREGIDDLGGDAAGDAHQSKIRGPLDGPGAGSDRRRIGAQERLDARNAHLRTSLQLHAARVAKRAAEQQQGADKPSAQERLLAIRRRVAERIKSGQEGRTSPRVEEDQSKHLDYKGGDWESAEGAAKRQRTGGDTDAGKGVVAQGCAEARSRVCGKNAARADHEGGSTEDDGAQATAAERLEKESDHRRQWEGAAKMPVAGSAPADSTSRRNELRQQIHLVHDGGRIHGAPACEDEVGVGARLRPGASADAANEASRVAWHSIERVTRRPR